MNKVIQTKNAIIFAMFNKKLVQVHNEEYVLKIMRDILSDNDLSMYDSKLEKQFIKYFNLCYSYLEENTKKTFLDTLNGGIKNESI